MSAILAAASLSVRIGAIDVCTGLDLALGAGERLAILGRNGAGKSTLLATLAGLRPATAGAVRLGGKGYGEMSLRAAARLRGWLGQDRSDPFASTVLETVLTGRHPHLGRWVWESGRDAEIARAALAAMGLAGLEAREVQTLSGGERQRVAIATLLAQAPRLYLLDEPLAHLDLNHQVATLSVFARLARAEGAVIAMVLHEPTFAWRFCERALLLFGDGRHVEGPVAEVLSEDNLSRLYGHPLRRVAAPGFDHPVFVPQ